MHRTNKCYKSNLAFLITIFVLNILYVILLYSFHGISFPIVRNNTSIEEKFTANKSQNIFKHVS